MEFNRKDLIAFGGGAVVSFSPQGLYDLQSYYEAMEIFLASSQPKRLEQVRSRTQQLDPEMKKYLLNEGNALLWEDYFPSELRATVLVSVMSYFERYLNGVCTETAMLLRAPVSHKKLKGSSIERAQTFLTDVCSLTAPNSEQWQRMRQLQRLRNLVVHNGGMPDTPAEEAEAQRLAQNYPGCVSTEFGIDLEPEFVRHVFDLTSKFFDGMAAELAIVCNRVKKFEGGA